MKSWKKARNWWRRTRRNNLSSRVSQRTLFNNRLSCTKLRCSAVPLSLLSYSWTILLSIWSKDSSRASRLSTFLWWWSASTGRPTTSTSTPHRWFCRSAVTLVKRPSLCHRNRCCNLLSRCQCRPQPLRLYPYFNNSNSNYNRRFLLRTTPVLTLFSRTCTKSTCSSTQWSCTLRSPRNRADTLSDKDWFSRQTLSPSSISPTRSSKTCRSTSTLSGENSSVRNVVFRTLWITKIIMTIFIKMLDPNFGSLWEPSASGKTKTKWGPNWTSKGPQDTFSWNLHSSARSQPTIQNISKLTQLKYASSASSAALSTRVKLQWWKPLPTTSNVASLSCTRNSSSSIPGQRKEKTLCKGSSRIAKLMTNLTRNLLRKKRKRKINSSSWNSS